VGVKVTATGPSRLSEETLDETRIRRWRCIDTRAVVRMPSAARPWVGGRRPDAGAGGPLYRRGIRPLSARRLQGAALWPRRHEGLLRGAHPRARIRRNRPGSRDRVRKCPLSGLVDHYMAGELVARDQLKRVSEETTIASGMWLAPMYEAVRWRRSSSTRCGS